jgi:hypothetical protein
MRFDAMNDIKSLYIAAKNSGNQKDIAAYTEAVQSILESKPTEFLTNLEYIITSDIGLSRLDNFVEKYGLSIAAYKPIMECLNNCIEKCEKKHIDSSSYKECVEKYEMFRSQYHNCFDMYEYVDNIPDNYITAYYSFNENGTQNSKLIKGMIDTFKEAAIPDIIITADRIGESAVKQTLKFLENVQLSPIMNDFMYEAVQDCSYQDDVISSNIKSKGLVEYVTSERNKHDQYLRESLLLGNTDAKVEYSDQYIESVRDLVSYYEYKITGINESNNRESLQKEIYSLYEELEQIEEDTGDEILPMLPNNQPISEDRSWMNTRNKKTGEAPGYLSTNHDLGYGEDNRVTSSQQNDNDDMSLDDYRRPSADKQVNTEVEPDTDDVVDDDSLSEPGDDNLTPEDRRAVNNYYYYTYNNSNNQNTNSYNRDNSKTSDDHSTGKHINSHNNNTDDNSTGKGDYRGDNSSFGINKQNPNYKGESGLITLDLPFIDNKHFFENGMTAFTEAEGDADDSRPESDHPVKDTLQDIDREMMKKQQNAKQRMQNVQNAGRAAMKPVKRTQNWVMNTITDWKDRDENKIKEKMADPKARNGLFSAIKALIKGGSYLKAGVLLNPVFLFLTITNKVSNNKKETRLRHEMIGELKTEIEIIDEKIEDARRKGDDKEKYQLMRLRNEINKKLVRISGPATNKKWTKGEIV